VQNIILHQCGLGATSGKSPLYLGPESGGSSLIPGVNGICCSNSVPVTIVRGDDFFRETGINKLDLIKLDIEGFEKHAVAGMSRHIDKWRPIIMIEISEAGKEQFGNFATFIETFPKDYVFYFCQLNATLTVRTVLRPVDETKYSGFNGNVFCVPYEKRNLFLEVTDIP